MILLGSRIRLFAIFLAGCFLVACGGGGGGSSDRAQDGGGGSGTNAPPTISGQPGTQVRVGQSYSFQPVARDPEGASLRFTVQNLPSWASFDERSGRLTGRPDASALGRYAGIVIITSDGAATASLGPFSIDVVETGNGAAMLSWTPPTTNSDGSPLRDLAGYRVLYGQSADALSESLDLNDPSLSSYMVENLTVGTWYFAVVSVNSRGAASPLSNIASKVVS